MNCWRDSCRRELLVSCIVERIGGYHQLKSCPANHVTLELEQLLCLVSLHHFKPLAYLVVIPPLRQIEIPVSPL